MPPLQVAIPIYDGFTALDAVGPYDVLCRLPEAEVVFCSAEAGPKRTETGMLTLVAERSLGELPEPDVVVVPGGIGNRALLDPSGPYTGWLAEVHRGTRWTTSVCTGSLLLAAAGLLEGLEATTHWAARDTLAGLGAVPVAERTVFHPEQRIATAAGVSAGIDMALRLAAKLAGDEVAKLIQLGIEYDPDPPFDTGSAERAPAHLVELARSAVDAGG
jgi:putative intracellular protease/amidase